jgi:ethanolamine utilization protein EutN
MLDASEDCRLTSDIWHLTSTFMFLGKVVGTVWSTKKTPDLEGVRFLIIHPYDLDKEPTKNIVVVADRLGAGIGETVMCAYGKAARSAIGDQEMSIEAAVVGIVDRMDLQDALSEDARDAARELRTGKQ